MSSHEKTHSLVFLDLESTGIFVGSRRITELAFLAINRAPLSQALESRELPRLVQELCFQVNPGEDVSWNKKSIQMTGLDRDALAEEKSLKEQWGLVRSFLDSRPQPLTLVAHNGDKFDFRLLREEMARLDLSSFNCFCVDSIQVLRELDGRLEEGKLQEEQLSQATAQENQAKTLLKEQPVVANSNSAPLELLDVAKKPRLQITPTTDQTTSIGQEKTQSSGSRPVKRRASSGLKKSYSLKAAYERATGEVEFPGEHQALGDCRALLRVAIHSGTQFLNIVDEYKKRF